MQTFLPYPDFQLSAQSLDNRRLNKQIVEAFQIIKVHLKLSGHLPHTGTIGWRNHPAVKMWVGHTLSLYHYLQDCENVWLARGFKSHDSIFRFLSIFNKEIESIAIYPSWLGDARLHDSHKSMLYQKDPIYYSQFSNIPRLTYFWPTQQNQNVNPRIEDSPYLILQSPA